MGMPVVRVGIVRVRMRYLLVPMDMSVPFHRGPRSVVVVLVMRVVLVLVGVLHRLVPVQVRMALDEVQPDARRHQATRRGQR